MSNNPFSYKFSDETWRKVKFFLAIACVLVILILYLWVGREPAFQVVIIGEHFKVFHFLAITIAFVFLIFALLIDYVRHCDTVIRNDELIYSRNTFVLHRHKEDRVNVSQIASIEESDNYNWLILYDKDYRILLTIPNDEDIRQELEKRIAEKCIGYHRHE